MSHRCLIEDDLEMPYQKMSCRCLIEDEMHTSCKFFHYVWFDSENSSFILTLKEKNEKALTFNIFHFANFEISPSFQ